MRCECRSDVRGHKLVVQVRGNGEFMTGEVKQGRQLAELARAVSRVGQLGARVSKLVEEGVNHGVDGRIALCGGILEQAGNEVNCVGVGLAENLVEGMGLDLRKLVLHIVGVHGSNLFTSWCSQHFNDLHQLIDSRLAREERLAKHQFSHDATGRPNIDLGGIICCTKNQLGGTVVSRADVRHIGLVLDQYLCTTEITELEDATVRVEEEVLRLDVSVANALRVDVGESPEELVNVQLDLKDRHRCLHLVEESGRTVDSLGNKLLN